MAQRDGKRKQRTDKHRKSRPVRGNNEASETGETTEDVVLSSDDGYTPAAVVIEVMEKGELTESFDPKAEGQPEKKDLLSFAPLLDALRKPEAWLIEAYKKSGIRKNLVQKVEWYKDFEENRIIGHKLEAAYGSVASHRYQLHKFVGNNLLFSLLLCVGLIYSGRIAVTHIIQLDSQPDAAKKIQNIPITGPGPKSPAIPVNRRLDESRKNIEVTLAHCSVNPAVRKALLSTLGNDPDFTNNDLKQALRELRRFQSRFKASGVVQWYEQARLKNRLTAAALKSALPQAHDFLSSKKSERRKTQQLLENQKLQLRHIDDAGPLRGVHRINERIQARNLLNQLQEQLDQGPTPTDLLSLEDQLVSSQEVLNAPVADKFTWNPIAPAVLEFQNMDIEATRTFVHEITRVIDSLTAADSKVTAKLNAYRVRNLRDQLHQLTIALEVNRRTPTTLIHAIEHSQKTLNERLDPLLSEHASAISGPIDYNPCLDPAT